VAYALILLIMSKDGLIEVKDLSNMTREMICYPLCVIRGAYLICACLVVKNL